MKYKLTLLAVLLTAAVAGAYLLSRSTRFQVFGRMIHHVDTQEKVVALTIDDSPRPWTPELVAILDSLEVPATFFVIGKHAEDFPQHLDQLISKGHEIGSHSYSHKTLLFKTPSFIREDLEKNDRVLRGHNIRTELFRPPRGKKLLVLPYVLAQQNKLTVMWDICEDLQLKDPGAMGLDAAKQVTPGSIILFHDQPSSHYAIRLLITNLKKKGYRFLTVSQLQQHQKQPLARALPQ